MGRQFLLGAVVVGASGFGQLALAQEPLVDELAIHLRESGLIDEEDLSLVETPLAPPPASYEAQIAERVNLERAACPTTGCTDGPRAPLKFVSILTGVADEHSESMAIWDYFSHCDFHTGMSSSQRVTAAGYIWDFVGENVAAGNSTPAATMAQWMNSSPHRANILNSGFRELGAGYFQQIGDLGNIDYDANSDCDCVDTGESCSFNALTHYWTQVFGRRPSVYPMVIEDEKYQTSSGTVSLYVYGPTSPNDMRFSNDGVNWSNWQTYQAETAWTLAPGDGLRTVFSQVRKGSTTYSACDRIWRTGAGGGEVYVDSFECDGFGYWSETAP